MYPCDLINSLFVYFFFQKIFRKKDPDPNLVEMEAEMEQLRRENDKLKREKTEAENEQLKRIDKLRCENDQLREENSKLKQTLDEQVRATKPEAPPRLSLIHI